MDLPDSYLEFIDYWFQNPKKWFAGNSKVDEEIVSRFESLIEETDLNIFDKKFNIINYLANILITDQIVRHYDRCYNTTLTHECSEFAICCSLTVLEYKPKLLTLTPAQQCFILLPLRHSRQIKYVKLCQTIIMELIEMNLSNIPQSYLAFLKANMDCILNLVKPTYYEPIGGLSFPEVDGLLDPNCKFSSHRGIGINPLGKEISIPDEWQQSIRKIIPENKKIILSLSGGGDSMTLSYILRDMGYDVTALMIDYGNRDTCPDEVNMVYYWCCRLGINLYVLHMGEYLKRHNDERHSNIRAIYEDKTRRWRFASYHYVAQQIGADEPIVVLGHNKDDTYENIVANLCKSRSFTNLKGFRDVVYESDIMLCRPIREIIKADITQFANEANVPYLYDSTPKWSFRGRTRDQLIPFIDNFDKGFLKGLYHYAEVMQQQLESYLKLLENSTQFQKTERLIQINSQKPKKMIDVILVKYAPHNFDETYWTYIFETINRKYKYPMVGNKHIQKLISEIKSGKDVSRSLVKNVIIDVEADDNMFIVYYRN